MVVLRYDHLVAPDLKRPVAPDPYSVLPPVPSFQLTSENFRDGEPLPPAQTASGGSVSPQLSWSGFPENTLSFLLTCFDPDAPRGGCWHWVVANIPPAVTSVQAGRSRSPLRVLAGGLVGRTSSIGVDSAIDLPNTLGLTVFMGAAPPKGDRVHRYFFAVNALDVAALDLPHGRRTAADLVSATAVPHTLARAVLMGTCQR